MAFGPAILVAVIGLVVNLLSALMLGGRHDHDHDHDDSPHPRGHGHARPALQGDNNLRAAYLHVLADALTSVLAIFALTAGQALGWLWLDPAVGLLGAAVIARWSWGLMRDSASVLLDVTDPALEQEVRSAVEGPGDAWITDLHLWRVGPEAHAVIVSTTGPAAAETIRARLRPLDELAHVTVETR